MIRTTALCAFGAAVFAALTPATAQSRLERDVDFVRKLATELRFIGLAQTEVEALQSEYRDSEDFKKVSQLGIEISLIGARSHPNREERRTLFKDALERSREFIDRYADDPVADEARRTYVQAAYEFGQFLLDEIELAREEAPDQVDDLEQQAGDVFRGAIEACESVISGLQAYLFEPGDEQNRLFAMRLYKGMLQREMARALSDMRERRADIARETLEELVFDAGEHKLIGQRAYFEMSKVGEVLGNYDTAFRDYNDTISTIQTALDDADEIGLPPEAQELMINLLQEAYDRAAICLFRQGKVDETLKFVSTFRSDLTKYGEEGLEPFEIAHPQYGHPVFLTEARAMAESGDDELVAEALELVQQINDAHSTDMIGLRAKQVLEDILAVQSDQVSGALLYEVAKGDYQERDYELAIQGFKRAYAAMTDAERAEFGLELWTSMARSFGVQQRYLESALAAAEGLEKHGRDATGTAETTADVLDQAWRGYLRNVDNTDDPVLQPLKDRFLELLAEHLGEASEAKLLWREGNRLHGDRKYLEAAARYAEIPPDTPYYEPAQGRVAVCYQAAGDFERAREAIESYREWLTTDAAELPADRTDLAGYRAETRATIAFYDAYMDYLEATGQAGDNGDSDPSRYRGIINDLQAFLDQHSEAGANYVERAYDIMARLHAQLGEVGKAEQLYRTLRNKEPNSSLLPLLATQIFKTHYDTVKALKTELEALNAQGINSGDEYDDLFERLQQARRNALASGLDYMKNSGSPSYGVLYSTLVIARDLAQYDSKVWRTVEDIGRRILDDFGTDTEESENVAKYVTPKLGEALLRQRKFREAVPFLENAAEARPNDYPLKRLLSLAQGGWFEFDDRGTVQEVTGLDEPKLAYERHWNEYRKYVRASGIEKFSLEWYEFIWECYAFATRAADKGDSDMAESRDTLFRMARSIDNFETLRTQRGKRGLELFQLFNSVGRR